MIHFTEHVDAGAKRHWPLVEDLTRAVFDDIDLGACRERVAFTHRLHLGLARVDERVVGFKIAAWMRPDRLYSWLGCVDPAWRRRGIASALLVQQHAWARGQGIRLVRTATLNRWPGMVALNLAHGLEIIGTTTQGGQPKLILEKRL